MAEMDTQVYLNRLNNNKQIKYLCEKFKKQLKGSCTPGKDETNSIKAQ